MDSDSATSVPELPTLNLVHGLSSGTKCQIHMLGATITSWKVDGEEMLYLSKQAQFDGKHSVGIRGGVSVFFPHIGPWMFGPTNGFAKTSREWKVFKAPMTDRKTGDSRVVLSLEDSAATRKIWSRKFLLLYTITLTKNSLALKADVTNKGDMTIAMGFTFRPHVLVPDVTKCQLGDFKGLFFTDKAEDGWPDAFQRQNFVTINGYTDRIYTKAPPTCYLEGLKRGRRLLFQKEGFPDTACWNPWNKFKLPDMSSDDYRNMLCVDAAQSSKKAVLKNGDTWTGSYTITTS